MPKILLVEDEEVDRMVCRDVLEDTEFELIIATNGEDAREKIKTERFDLILLDSRLPHKKGDVELVDEEGFYIAQELKANSTTKDIPVIFITILGHDWLKEEVTKLGIPFIRKPFNPLKLPDMIKKELAKKK